MSRLVEIVPLEMSDRGVLFALAEEIPRVFPLGCRVGASGNLPEGTRDNLRGQYHATRILEHLDSPDTDAFRVLGVTSVDIFTPILRYVFGEAMFPGRAALVSTYRLGVTPPRRTDLRNRTVFISRVVKEGVHELAHTFGLTHCKDPRCVMSASLNTDHIDAKSTQLCYYCKVALEDGLSP
jgi:archaemetzincin